MPWVNSPDEAFPSTVTPTAPVSDAELEYAARLFRSLTGDPAVEHWSRAEAKRQPELRSALDVIGMQRGYLAGLLKGVLAPETIQTWDEGVDYGPDRVSNARAWFMSAAVVLEGARPFLWFPDMYALATGSRLPPHVIAPFELPHDPMAWWFSRPAQAVTRGGKPRATAYGLLLTALDEGRRLVVVELGVAAGGSPTSARTDRFDIRAGQTYGTDFDEHSRQAEILQMLSFLRSRYVTTERQRPRPDQEKRMRKRAGRPVVLPDVMVIKLRAAVPVPASRDRTSSRRWSHRWMVRGHHRAQWYPSLAAHKVLWIAPHFKGPPDAPIAQQVYAVIR